MLSYASETLIEPDADTLAFAREALGTHTLVEWARRTWPAEVGLLCSTAWRGYLEQVPPRINVLSWPAGASRFASGWFLIDEEGLGRIRDYVHGGTYALSTESGAGSGAGSSTNYRPAKFQMKDGRGTGHEIETDLWMLPPRGLARVKRGTPGLYLITLVDDRFFWWSRSISTLEFDDVSTWADMYTQLEVALGRYIWHDSVHADYLSPSSVLAQRYRPLPLLIDGIAGAVGQRVIRQLDGRVETLTATNSLERMVENLNLEGQQDGPGRLTGHEFDLHQGADNGRDLEGLAPASLTIVLADDAGAATHSQEVTLTSLAISEYANKGGHHGGRALWFPAPAGSSGLSTFCERAARDWYLWRLGRAEAVYDGVVPWEPEGHTELIEWVHVEGVICTRVRRGPWLDFQYEPPAAAGGDTSFLAVLTAKDHSGPFIAYSWTRVTDGAGGGTAYTLYSPLTYGCPGNFPAYHEQANVDLVVVPTAQQSGSGAGCTPASSIHAACVVRLRKGKGDWYWIDHEPRWEYIYANGDAPILSGGILYSRGNLARWDQDLKEIILGEEVLFLDLSTL